MSANFKGGGEKSPPFNINTIADIKSRTMQPRIYTYKITFEEVPYYYYGSKKEKVFDEEYWGSPVANKWCWELYTPKKQILEVFDYTDKGYEECRKIEDRLIKPVLNDNWCLNERCGGNYSLEVLRRVAKKRVENKIGLFALSSEELSKLGKKGGKIGGSKGAKTQMQKKIGIYGLSKKERSENSKKAGNKSKELGVGICRLTIEQRRDIQKRSVEKQKKNKTGIFGLTAEQRAEIGAKNGERNKILLVKNYSFISPTGELFEGTNISQFCREQNLSNSMMCRVLNGKRKQHKGWKKA